MRRTAARLALIMALALSAPLAWPAGAPAPGHTRALQVPQLDLPAGIDDQGTAANAAPVIDGVLDDAVWKRAATAGDFWVSEQQRAPADGTEVLVLADAHTLYIGFRIYDSRAADIQAVQTRRDAGLGFDDQVAVELDSYFNRRDISRFALNANGVQDDSLAGGRSTKIEWKGDWRGAAARTAYGWSAEMAIPFALLGYQDGDVSFGANFLRYQHRSGEWSRWADITPRNLPEEMGRLDGLVLPPASDRPAWVFMPYALMGWNIPDKQGEVRNRQATVGMDLRYQPRPNITGMLALNPDFSQIEKQITDIDFSYNEKLRADVRPFFEDGADYFGPTEYFYSNRVPDFDYGAKAYGRAGHTRFGMLASSAPDGRDDLALRLLQELDATHSISTMLVTSNRPDLDNRLAAVELAGRETSGLTYAFGTAITRSAADTDSGNRVSGALGWKGDYWSVNAVSDRYDVVYRPANGLLNADLPGTAGVNLAAGYYRETAGTAWRSLRADASYTRRETADGELQLRQGYGALSVEFRNQIRVSLAHTAGPYRPVTGLPGVFEPQLNPDRYTSASLDFNTRSTRLGYGLIDAWGFLDGVDYAYRSAYLWWRPIRGVYLDLSGERLASDIDTDRIVAIAQWDITSQDSLSTRYINQDGVGLVRLAYGRRVRKGVDVFAVYNQEPPLERQWSVKLLITYP